MKTGEDHQSPGGAGLAVRRPSSAGPLTDFTLGSGVRIRKNDPCLYKKVAWHVFEQILNGQLTADSPVPVINVLCRDFGCTRQTAAKGLRLLVDEGLLVREPGLGYFVAETLSG